MDDAGVMILDRRGTLTSTSPGSIRDGDVSFPE
jgi:hypothetical protein